MSYEKEIKEAADELEKLLKSDKAFLEKIASETMDTCEIIEKSWSGSWLGYHASLYYEGFQAPPRGRNFSIEWGGIHGLPSYWQDVDIKEMWKYIISKSKVKVDIDKTNDKELAVQEAASSLKTLYELSNTNEVLSKKIADINTDFDMKDFIKYRMPSTMMSRDQEAAAQGTKVPPHVQCQAFGQTIRQNISAAEQLLKIKPLVLATKDEPIMEVKLMDNELSHLNPLIAKKVGLLFQNKHYSEAVGKAMLIVKDRLRDVTGYENGFPAFSNGGLYIKGSAAKNVDDDFQEAVKRLLGAIDKFRNEKFHTSEANLKDKNKALSYLHICDLALSFLEDGKYQINAKK